MKLFDDRVQETKYKVLREVAIQTWKGNDVFAEFNEIASNVITEDIPPTRCCIYKDRAVVAERVRLALGGSRKNKNVVQVISIACDECTEAGYVVTDLCRGCLANNCVMACKLNAITIDSNHHARIDKAKCIDCGKCAKACKYSAIHNFQRPCEIACKADAISMAPGGEASIDPEKCIDCGSCVYHCPFGATVDVSSIVDVVNSLKESRIDQNNPTIAIVAPSIASQFLYANLGQVISGIKKLGFHQVLEVALGADMVAKKETEELMEKGFLTSSCCPAFVKYIETRFPNLVEHISHNLSPMAELAKFIKKKHPESKIVFIGPCIAKKAEVRKPEVSKYIDYAITFEELQALFDSRDILLREQEETDWNQASYYGRSFARAGGLTQAVSQALKEMGEQDFEFNPIACDGIAKCKAALMRADKGVLPNNFIEGMICTGGCVGGSGNLIHYDGAPDKLNEHVEKASATEIIPNVKKAINIG
ncbi:[FeFe] hydrogenase (group B1/B3) [Clostridiales Family XIII bacterium PM5-7]